MVECAGRGAFGSVDKQSVFGEREFPFLTAEIQEEMFSRHLGFRVAAVFKVQEIDANAQLSRFKILKKNYNSGLMSSLIEITTSN